MVIGDTVQISLDIQAVLARHIRTAIDFATAHREAINEQVAANDAAAELARRLAEQRASLMAS